MLTYIIDDEPISLFLTEQVLRQEGVMSPIRPFQAAEEALQSLVSRLTTEVPDVILLDLNMPLMNGWEFLEALQPHTAELAGRCHIYILTSSLALADTARAKDFALVSGVIHKPLNEDEVQSIQHAARRPHPGAE
jgi:CheY-like chemotaxis protein